MQELYALNLTKRELEIIEDTLFEKSSILTSMAKYKSGKQDIDGARLLDGKALQMERLAGKASVILDDLSLVNTPPTIAVAIKKQGKVVLYKKGEGYYAVDYTQPYDVQSLTLTTLDEATKLFEQLQNKNKGEVNV